MPWSSGIKRIWKVSTLHPLTNSWNFVNYNAIIFDLDNRKN